MSRERRIFVLILAKRTKRLLLAKPLVTTISDKVYNALVSRICRAVGNAAGNSEDFVEIQREFRRYVPCGGTIFPVQTLEKLVF